MLEGSRDNYQFYERILNLQFLVRNDAVHSFPAAQQIKNHDCTVSARMYSQKCWHCWEGGESSFELGEWGITQTDTGIAAKDML